MVRRRANKADLKTISQFDLPPNLTNNQFIDSVINERAWEFCGEPEGRWFDVLRLEKVHLIEKFKLTGPGLIYSFPINEKTFFYPIPNSEQVLNRKLR